MKRFKINLFGITLDSSKYGKSRVEALGQAAIDNYIGHGKALIHVNEFDDEHIKVTIERHIDPLEVNSHSIILT